MAAPCLVSVGGGGGCRLALAYCVICACAAGAASVLASGGDSAGTPCGLFWYACMFLYVYVCVRVSHWFDNRRDCRATGRSWSRRPRPSRPAYSLITMMMMMFGSFPEGKRASGLDCDPPHKIEPPRNPPHLLYLPTGWRVERREMVVESPK